MFLSGLAFCFYSFYHVVFLGNPIYISSDSEGIGKPVTDSKIKFLIESGFLAGWVLVFTLILYFTSTKAKPEKVLGNVLLIDKAGAGRLFWFISIILIALLPGAYLYFVILGERTVLTPKGILSTLAEALLLYMAAYVLFRVDRIRFDFLTRTWQQDLGFAWNPKHSTGTFDDLKYVRLTTQQHDTSEGGSYTTWDIYLVWKNTKMNPILVDQRPRGFHDIRNPPPITSREQAKELADKMGLRLHDETEQPGKRSV